MLTIKMCILGVSKAYDGVCNAAGDDDNAQTTQKSRKEKNRGDGIVDSIMSLFK